MNSDSYHDCISESRIETDDNWNPMVEFTWDLRLHNVPADLEPFKFLHIDVIRYYQNSYERLRQIQVLGAFFFLTFKFQFVRVQ